MTDDRRYLRITVFDKFNIWPGRNAYVVYEVKNLMEIKIDIMYTYMLSLWKSMERL